MAHYPYLIVGAGMAAAAAVEGIRSVDQEHPIGIIGAEADPPYKRPPLSKALWQGKPLEKIWYNLQDGGVELLLGREVTSINPRRKQVVDAHGTIYTFDKLLFATGSSPRRFPWGGEDVIYFRTVADYRRLRALADRGDRIGVIGAGFIGAELAASLAAQGKQVALFFPEAAIGERVYGPALAAFLSDYYQHHGVELHPRSTVTGVDRRGERLVLHTRDGHDEPVDGVVAGIGVRPNIDLAQAAGLAVDDGVVVDECLRTSHPDIYAAGDVASFFDPALGKRRRVEHEDNARAMGRLAGAAMAGNAQPYGHLPFFYSDLFDLGYEAVGEIDARLEVVADWKVPFREGVVYYLGDGRIHGVLLWNVWDQVDAARQLIGHPGPFSPHSVRGLLPA